MSFENIVPDDSYIKIDGIGDIHATPSQQVKTITDGNNISIKMLFRDMHCPYPVKKEQVLTATTGFLFHYVVTIRFAPCMSI